MCKSAVGRGGNEEGKNQMGGAGMVDTGETPVEDD